MPMTKKTIAGLLPYYNTMSTDRYARQTVLRHFGAEGQARLTDSAVLVVGAGGLGTPVLQYLNAMGVGRIGVVEPDTIERNNLPRQVVYPESAVGRPKLEVMLRQLRAQNPSTTLKGFDIYLNRNNALEIIADFDLVVDASDNFATRYLVNDACVILNKPFVYGALYGWEGQVSVFNLQSHGQRGPTYRCLFPYDEAHFNIPDCNANGVLGVLPGLVGCYQALEAVKVLSKQPSTLSGRLLIIDGLTSTHREVRVPLNRDNLAIDTLAKRYSPAMPSDDASVAAHQLDRLCAAGAVIVDVRTSAEYQAFCLPGTQSLPLVELPRRIAELPVGQPLYLLCASGQRSRQAAALIRQLRPEVMPVNVRGGLQAYQV